MSKNKINGVGLLVLLICMQFPSFAQEKSLTDVTEKTGLYSLNVFAGGGVSFYVADPGSPSGLKSQVSQTHAIGTLRVMWYPDHLLRIGLETGITDFYSYKIQDSVSGSLVVQAVPLLLVFSMPITKHINVYLAPGGYFITSKLNYKGYTRSGTFSLGWMVAGSYEYPINDKLGVAGEVKLLDAFETKDASLSVQIQLRWKFMEW
jgi:hypothetical protein